MAEKQTKSEYIGSIKDNNIINYNCKTAQQTEIWEKSKRELRKRNRL